jgi:hypothetical protein
VALTVSYAHLAPERRLSAVERRQKKPDPSAVLQATGFLRKNAWKVAAVSAGVLLPCFWHARIEAGDLASHTYNAWLAQLVEQGKAPGLWIARQWTNVLFDVALLRLGSIVGLRAAERVVVSAVVLIFFWGAFALATAASARRPWTLTPLIAMLAYGWTFSMGFMNFYVSLGLSFFVLALVWRGRSLVDALVALLLLPLIWLAHPLGVAWVLPAAIYVLATKRTRADFHVAWLAGAGAFIVLLRWFLGHPAWFPLGYPTWLWRLPFYDPNGADQLVVYGFSYALVASAVLAVSLGFLLLDGVQRWHGEKHQLRLGVAAQLYVLAVLAFALLPNAALLPQYAAPVSMLMERFSLVAAVLGCCVLAGMPPRKLHAVAFGLIAAVFFALYYTDTLKVERLEQQVEEMVAGLPPGQRVVETIHPFPESRLYSLDHIVDRACIGRCFSYANYEPSSTQFRLRARPGNGMVTADMWTSLWMQKGEYVVQPQDLPMYGIYQCNSGETKLCIRALRAGETTGFTGRGPR